MKSLKSIALLVIILVFASCKNDDDLSITPENQDSDPTAFAQNFFGSEISRTFLGIVVDTNNNPIENVSISIGSATAMTDSNGVFIISDASVNQRFGFVKAEKAGYIHASRAVVPSEGTNKVLIMMLPETVAGSTSSGTQETIALGNGASVALEGEYIKPDGTAYSGNVNVIMHHLDPTDENMQDQMPGMLYAANVQNEERMLQTFGMLAVELRGENGEDLNLTEGSTAEITVPLDASLIADAPATIPLWYFDETHGYWIEEGHATLVGNEYVGTVSHFSFWNCDIPAEAVNFCVTITDESGNGLANLTVSITSDTYGTTYGYTNASGKVCGLVPSNEPLEINVYNFDICGESPIYTDTIGPFGADSNISVTIPDNPDIIFETLTGTFMDCDGNPVITGYVRLEYGGQYFTDTVTDGEFEIDLTRCNEVDTFRIEAYDYDNFQETGVLYYTFTTPLTNLGTIQSCNTVEEFITYQVDDHPVIIYSSEVQGGLDNWLNISYESEVDPNVSFNLYIGSFNGLGSYTNLSLYFYDINNDSVSDLSDFTGTANVTAFGDVGEYIDINFTGNIDDFINSTQIPMSGTIHVIRDY